MSGSRRLLAGLCLAGIALFAAGPASSARAEDTPPATADAVTSKADALKRLQDQLNDPDPLIRLAAMDAASKSDDPLTRKIAIKTALASSDTDIQTMALLMLVKAKDGLVVEFALQPDFQKAYDDANAKGDDQVKAFKDKNEHYLNFAGGLSGGLTFKIEKIDEANAVFTGTIAENKDLTYRGEIVAGTVRLKSEIRSGGLSPDCMIDLKVSGEELLGETTCSDNRLPLPYKSRIKLM